MKTIAIVNQNGGIGKTTTTVFPVDELQSTSTDHESCVTDFVNQTTPDMSMEVPLREIHSALNRVDGSESKRRETEHVLPQASSSSQSHNGRLVLRTSLACIERLMHVVATQSTSAGRGRESQTQEDLQERSTGPARQTSRLMRF
jgi:hypothetical protein